MIEVLEVFDGANNVDFKGFEFLKAAGKELPLFTIKEQSVEEWNAKAEVINTKSFIRLTGKRPANYSEVREWVDSLIPDKEKSPTSKA